MKTEEDKQFYELFNKLKNSYKLGLANTLMPEDIKLLTDRIRNMFLTLLECRDAIPAIKLDAAKLRNIDLTLDKKIEAVIAPWEVPPVTPGAL